MDWGGGDPSHYKVRVAPSLAKKHMGSDSCDYLSYAGINQFGVAPSLEQIGALQCSLPLYFAVIFGLKGKFPRAQRARCRARAARALLQRQKSKKGVKPFIKQTLLQFYRFKGLPDQARGLPPPAGRPAQAP